MKKLVVAIVGLALIGTAAFAQNQVLSRNAVGYTRVDCLSNSYTLSSVPFNAFSNTVAGIFAGQLQGGATYLSSDQVIKYDPASSSYVIFWKTVAGQWRQFGQSVETTNKLWPGEGFWIFNRRTSNQTVYLMGEVPDAYTLPSNEVDFVEGYNMASFSYPVAMAITNTTLTNGAARGATYLSSDQIVTYSPILKAYTIYWLSTSAGSSWRKFGQTTNTPDQFTPGQGFWFKRRTGSGALTWSERKPYTWP